MAGMTTVSVANIIGRVMDLIISRDWPNLDSKLHSLDVGVSTPAEIMALIRSSFPVRSKLDSWKPLLERSYTELCRRGLDADRIMRGLM